MEPTIEDVAVANWVEDLGSERSYQEHMLEQVVEALKEKEEIETRMKQTKGNILMIPKTEA